MGYANVAGRADHTIDHLRAVPGMSPDQAHQHITAAGDLWTTRSRRTWTLDLSMLTIAGVTLARPDAPETRRDRAHAEVQRQRSIPPDPAPVSPVAATIDARPRPWWRRLTGR
jgi:hypothetical protein